MLEFGNGFAALVGANNSGKSAALRAVYELRSYFADLIYLPQNPFNRNPLGITDIAELSNDADTGRFQFELELTDYRHPQTHGHFVATAITIEFRNSTPAIIQLKALDLAGRMNHWANLEPSVISLGMESSSQGWSIGYANVDIAALSSFANELSQSKYYPAFRNAINEGAGSYYDLPVGTALVSTWDQWKAGSYRAHKIAINRVEREIADLLGFRSLQINADQSGKTLDVIIDGRPQKLYEVGAGVAQLIIVLAAALIHKPPYILIDEPELSLHPALQLNFLATLGAYAQKGVIYSTHSISLARSTAERIYAVKKIGSGSSRMHPFGDNKINFGGWLGELSYSSRVELGCEGVLLVEGPTEVMCFQEFLRKLGKDHKYVLLQLGGSSLIRGGVIPHLSEIARIVDPAKIHAFIDSERDAADAPLAPDRAAFIEDCRSIGINVCASERKATDNYFEANGIQKALGPEFKPLAPYQKLKTCEKPWHKSDNWRIARETEFKDIENTDLGRFLSSL
ncbi:MAG: AAA family ATPase [Gallionella sp.]|nr:AAA family ATPase [Gallionella sp.]MDD4946703.1 AAA family ATPase [Gallionella sp.]